MDLGNQPDYTKSVNFANTINTTNGKTDRTGAAFENTNSTGIQKARLIDRKRQFLLKYPKQQGKKVDNLSEKVSVEVMAFCGIKNHHDKLGIQGYNAPRNPVKVHTHGYKMPTHKKKDGMLDYEMKSHGDNPSPMHYDIVVNMALERKTNSITSKKPRKTIIDDITSKEKKFKHPGVGAYETITPSKIPFGKIS